MTARFFESLLILILVGTPIAAFLWMFVGAVTETQHDHEHDYIRPNVRDV